MSEHNLQSNTAFIFNLDSYAANIQSHAYLKILCDNA
jgi:hypothetical protein